MNKRVFSFMIVIVLCVSMFPLSVLASSNITSAEYADGVVAVSGTGFTAGVTNLVRVVDTVNDSIKALANVTATLEGNIDINITTGALTDLSNYVVRINKLDGTIIASRQVEATSETTTETPTPTPQPAGTIAVTANVDSTGKATAVVTDTKLSQAVANAVKAALSGNKDADVIVEIKVIAEGAKEVSLELTKASILTLSDSNVDNFIVNTELGIMNLDQKVIEEIKSSLAEAAASAKVHISIATVDTNAALEKYPEAAKKNFIEKIGHRPVYDFNLTAGNQKISDFKGGTVTVTLPYTLKAGENQNAVVIYYVDEKGNLKTIANGKYNPLTKSVSLKTKHFSSYAIGYNEKKFEDVADDIWYSTAVDFVAARGITEGIGGNHFAPKSQITRADFLIMVMKAYGIEVDNSVADNFADAGNKYYTKYLGTAKKLGLVAGSGDNLYQPEKNISRQDMFVILYNVLESIGELPTGITSGKTLTDYKDMGKIVSYAQKAMKLFVETGVVSGSNGNLIPKDTTTRAETVQTLYNLMIK